MRRVAWVAVALIGGVVTIVASTASPAVACSCLEWGDAEAYAAAEAVFVGDVVDVDAPTVGDETRSDDPVRVRFDVAAVYKGAVAPAQTVLTNRDSSMCGFGREMSGTYLVFAGSYAEPWWGPLRAGELSTNICTGTRRLGGEPVPDALGHPRPPSVGPAVARVSPSTGSAVTLAAAAGLTVVLGGGATVLRRRRAPVGRPRGQDPR